MSSDSPKWKNPADIMKMRTVKRRTTLTRRKTIHDPTGLSSVLTQSSDRPVSINKRKNPFGCNSENKRPNLGTNNDNIDEKPEAKQFFKALDDVAQENVVSGARSDSRLSTEGDGHLTDHNKENQHNEEKMVKSKSQYRQEQQDMVNSLNMSSVRKEMDQSQMIVTMAKEPRPTLYHQHLPIDWSVKVKMRIVSEAPLAWCTQLKMVDEAKAVTQHVQNNQQWGEDSKSAFHSCCLHWMHPNIPWLRLFPRIVAEQKLSNVSIVAADDTALEGLHRDWTESFTSVFHLLRAGRCPYFYLCTHQFTVVFRASGVNKHASLNACLTPTTRGLREALKTEGISFRMPNLEGKKMELSPEKEDEARPIEKNVDGNGCDKGDSEEKSSKNEEDMKMCCSKLDVDDEDLIDNDEGASVWLESLGLDKKAFPSLDPNKVKLQREGFRRVDNRPESLVYVDGPDVQAMFNFLLNCRSCTASSGPQAGIPPTILAPVAFKGATLKPNKLKHSVAKQTDNSGSIKKSHVIEMSGPILPHHVMNVAHLLRDIQSEDFTLTFNTHEPTSPLNVYDVGFGQRVAKDCEVSGLHPLAQLTLCGPDSLKENRVYKEVRRTMQGFQYEL